MPNIAAITARKWKRLETQIKNTFCCDGANLQTTNHV